MKNPQQSQQDPQQSDSISTTLATIHITDPQSTVRTAGDKQTQETQQDTAQPTQVTMHTTPVQSSVTSPEVKQDLDTPQYAYEVGTGIDTYLYVGKSVTTLRQTASERKAFEENHPLLRKLLMRQPLNPLLEEGKFIIERGYVTGKRDRKGEYFITNEALKIWLDSYFNPKLKASNINHQVFCCKSKALQTVFREAEKQQCKQFSIIFFEGIHAYSAYIDLTNNLGFVLDCEDPNYESLVETLYACHPNLRMKHLTDELSLQMDFFSCVTIGIKACKYFAKHGDSFSAFLNTYPGNVIQLADIPAVFLKLLQSTKVHPTDKQLQTIVSQKKEMTLKDHRKQHCIQFTYEKNGKPQQKVFNTAAIKTKYKVFHQIEEALREQALQENTPPKPKKG